MEVKDTPASSGTLFCTSSMSDSTIWDTSAVPDMSSSAPAGGLCRWSQRFSETGGARSVESNAITRQTGFCLSRDGNVSMALLQAFTVRDCRQNKSLLFLSVGQVRLK